MYNHTRKFIGAFVIAFSFLATAQAVAVSPYLIQAQEAFLNKDNNRAMESIGRALRETKLSSPEFKNLSALYGRIARDSNQQVDLGWKLPDSVTGFRVTVQFFDVNGDRQYRLNLSGSIKSGITMKSLNLRKYPDYVVIDSDKKIGTLENGIDQWGSYFYSRTKSQTIPISAGVYLLDFETSLGEVSKGWFVVTEDLNSSETPDFVGLKDGQEFQQLDPSFTWNSFISPQYQKGEKRVMRFALHPLQSDGNWLDPIWMYNDPTAAKTSMNLALDMPTEPSISPVKNGEYMVTVSYLDSKVNLPIKITRDSRVGRKIVIQTK